MKQRLAGLATLIIGLSSFQSSFAMATTSEGFTDVPSSHPNYEAIMALQADGVIGGYPDGTYKPDQEVNRVESLKIILLGAAIEVPESTAELIFTDTDSTQWYAKYILKAFELAIVNGYPDKTFKPTQTVNLVEALKMLSETKEVDLSEVDTTVAPFADAGADQWYTKYVQYGKENEWIEGDSQNMVYPDQAMTRGKLAQLLYNAMKEELPPPVEEPTPLADMSVKIESFAFSPNVITIAQGTKVTWTNKDPVIHTVTSDDDGFQSSSSLSEGETYSYTFNELGTFDYHCTPHPTMEGQIIVKPANEVPTI
ncbi:MAG TPA: S-layer homology domain-containing protein [Candidatus Gracilibacteria bacterium]|nr:S-layer homology domain-containing protein [Candidatus Gracilibacteria bacterium]